MYIHMYIILSGHKGSFLIDEFEFIFFLRIVWRHLVTSELTLGCNITREILFRVGFELTE